MSSALSDPKRPLVRVATQPAESMLRESDWIGPTFTLQHESMDLPRWPIIVLLVATLAWCVCSRPLDAGVIELKDQARARTGVIRLGDIATIHAADADQVEQLGDLVVAPSPAVGRMTRVGFEAIRQRLTAAGYSTADWDLRGASIVQVRAVSDPVAPTPSAPRALEPVMARPVPPRKLTTSDHKQAERRLLQVISEQYQPEDSTAVRPRIRLELQRADVARVLAADPENIRLALDHLQFGGPQRLLVCLQPVTTVAGPEGAEAASDASEIEVLVWVTEAPQFVSVSRSIPAGQVLAESDLCWVEGAENSAGLTSWQDAIGKEARRTLRPQQLLQARDLAPITLVRNNEVVTVSVRRGGVVVRMPFKSRSAGGLDEIVTLASLDTPGQSVQARITGFHEAELVLPRSSTLTSAIEAAGPATPLPVGPRESAAGSSDSAERRLASGSSATTDGSTVTGRRPAAAGSPAVSRITVTPAQPSPERAP